MIFFIQTLFLLLLSLLRRQRGPVDRRRWVIFHSLTLEIWLFAAMSQRDFVFVRFIIVSGSWAHREFIRKKRTQKVLRSDHISHRISTKTRFATAERESARWFNSWTNDVSFSAISRIFSSLELITPTIPYLYLSASSKWRLITKYMIQQANMRDFVKLYHISRNNAAALHKQQVDILSISCKLARW